MKILYRLAWKKSHTHLVRISKQASRSSPARCCDCESDDSLASSLWWELPGVLTPRRAGWLEQLSSDPDEGVINRATKERRCDGLSPPTSCSSPWVLSAVSSSDIEPVLHCWSCICGSVKLQGGRLLATCHFFSLSLELCISHCDVTFFFW